MGYAKPLYWIFWSTFPGKAWKQNRTDCQSWQDYFLAERGKYARLCIEVDLRKPLLLKYRLRRRIRRIEYEGIDLICFRCGCYGHREETCEVGRPATVAHDPGQEDERIRPVTRNKEPTPEAMSTYGPWMLVQRNRYGARSLFPPQPPNPI